VYLYSVTPWAYRMYIVGASNRCPVVYLLLVGLERLSDALEASGPAQVLLSLISVLLTEDNNDFVNSV
jgi:hypothetical protein